MTTLVKATIHHNSHTYSETAFFLHRVLNAPSHIVVNALNKALDAVQAGDYDASPFYHWLGAEAEAA